MRRWSGLLRLRWEGDNPMNKLLLILISITMFFILVELSRIGHKVDAMCKMWDIQEVR